MVEIPHGIGETPRVWGYVMKAKQVGDLVPIVVDAVLVINKDTRFQPQSCVAVDRTWIARHIPCDPSMPTLHIQIIEGEVMGMLRIDGQKAPIIVAVDEDGEREIYSVSHQRGERILD